MKKVLCIAAVMFMVASLAYAFTPGRDIQPVSVSSGSITATNTDMLSDTLTQDSATFNPYSETSKTFTNVKKIEIWNAAKGLRFSNVSGNTATTYWVIPSTSPGYTIDGLKLSTITIYLKGDAATDTGTAMFNVWK